MVRTWRPDFTGLVLAGCALTLTAMVLAREVTGRDGERATLRQDRLVPDWPSLVQDGRASADSAEVTLLVFGDFECPACRRFHIEAHQPALVKFGKRLRWVFRHYPLAYHRFAVPAAIAAECAAEAGKFFEMVDALYQAQDSLGLKSFDLIAREAGVSDIVAFVECRTRQHGMERVTADLATAKALALGGTPAIAIGGVMLGDVPDGARLAELIAREGSGRTSP